MTDEMISYEDLVYGEVYITTVADGTYSYYSDEYPIVTIPKNQNLLFRSIQPFYSPETDEKDLVVFYWLEKRESVCLLISNEAKWLFLKPRNVSSDDDKQAKNKNDALKKTG